MIESLSNNLIKHACSLKDKKYRNVNCEFLAEGQRLIDDLIRFNDDKIVHIFSNKHFKHNKFKLVSDKIIKKLSDTNTPQNIVAIVKKKEIIALEKFISLNKNILFLDRISDPNNLGAIVRTAVAANYALILHNCVDIYSNKVVRGSMGAVLKTDFLEGDINVISILKQYNYKILSSCISGKNLFNIKINSPVCLIIGSEAHGVQKEIISLSDEIISIPMMDTESLNASVAAGILAYQFFRL
ncbi:MAG: RNA methyltransferase [Firmicutes bacterium]|nr:RNA methyltransferase [Bacillota bacterium]